MIIKAPPINGANLAKLLNFIESHENKVPHEKNPTKVTTLKCVNPGNEPGLYMVELDFMDRWNTGDVGGARRTDAKYLTSVYQILIDQ